MKAKTMKTKTTNEGPISALRTGGRGALAPFVWGVLLATVVALSYRDAAGVAFAAGEPSVAPPTAAPPSSSSGTSSASAPAAPAAASASGEAAQGQPTEPGGPLVSVVFYETDLREALNEVATQTGVNIVVSDTVQGTVTLSLSNVPLEKALRMMLMAGGYVWRKVDDFYVVGLPDSRSPLFATLSETRTVQLQNLKVSQARALLPSFYDPYIKGDNDGRTMTITAPPDVVTRFEQDVKQIDQPSPVRQVQIEAIVTEISTDVLKQWGSDLFQWTSNAGQTVNPNWKAILGLQGGSIDLQTDVYGLLLTKLQALEAENQAKIKANPRLVVADGSTANLFVGQSQVLVVPTSQTTAQIQQIDAGVTLKVTPRILGPDRVQVTLAPEVSYAIDASTTGGVGGGGAQEYKTPLISRNSLETTVVAQNGQTLALAGMTVGQTSASEQHVPILGDIPLLRWLFRSNTNQQSQRELVIFVTVKIE
ncbi:MAG: secretin [Limnochordaceae bacterium]|nr:secretin [Limnochordaceae bacterium]